MLHFELYQSVFISSIHLVFTVTYDMGELIMLVSFFFAAKSRFLKVKSLHSLILLKYS